MKALRTFLDKTGDRPADLARRIGVEPARLEEALAGATSLERGELLRIVDLAGGALTIADLTGEAVVDGVADMRARFAARDEIDIDALTAALAECLPALLGGSRRKGDDQLPRLAAEAAAGAYDALSTITTRRGADRLAQALRPIVSEILAEFSAPASLGDQAEAAIQSAIRHYESHRQARR